MPTTTNPVTIAEKLLAAGDRPEDQVRQDILAQLSTLELPTGWLHPVLGHSTPVEPP